MSRQQKFVSIEGCMGTGKTTLAKGLAAAIEAKPLIEESGRHPFIKEFYEAPDTYALETELTFVLLHYHQAIRENRNGIFHHTVVSDFALERDYVFSTLTLKNPDDWALFEGFFSFFKTRMPSPDVLVYLRAPVEFLAERIARRGRDYEKLMPRPYLEAVKNALDKFFLKQYSGEIVVFDAPNLDASHDPNYVNTVLAKLRPHLER